MDFAIQLSTKNFEDASKTFGNDEFCFLVENEKVYCHRFVASFISRNVYRLLITDPTLTSYRIDINSYDENRKEKIVPKIVEIIRDLINGQQIQIKTKANIQKINPNDSNSEFYNDIFAFLIVIDSLDNDEFKKQFCSHLFSALFPIKEADDKNSREINNKKEDEIEINIETEIEKYNFIRRILVLDYEVDSKSKTVDMSSIPIIGKEYFNQESYDQFIHYAASNFFKIKKRTIINMCPSLLEDLLVSPHLKIADEDSLLSILLERYSQMRMYNINEFHLFYNVCFANLSSDSIQNFLEFFSFDDSDSKIWLRIKERLILPVQHEIVRTYRYPTRIQFKYDGKDMFNGIIKHISELEGENPAISESIEIKTDNLSYGTLKSLFEFDNPDAYARFNVGKRPRRLEFDFKSKSIQISSYSIKSRDLSDSRSLYLTQWKVEISNDEKKWEMIDHHEDVTELSGEKICKMYDLPMTKPFRYIRFTSPNGFSLGNIEFFGTITDTTID